jgi:putative salt-induced outer membrane protein
MAGKEISRVRSPLTPCLALLITATASAQTPELELRVAEQRLATALTRKDAAAFERLLAPDFVLRGAPDVARHTWMKNAVSMCWGDRFEISDFAVRSTTPDSALVSLVLTTYQDPVTCEPAVIRSLLTDLWGRSGDGWQLALRHSGPAGSDLAAQFEKVAPPPPRWERTAELSLVATGGNTDTQTLGAGATLIWRPHVWTARARTAYVRSATDDIVSAESVVTDLRVSRPVTPRLEVFGRADYLSDEFSGIDYRTTFDGGVGWTVVDASPHTLKFEAGAGATYEARVSDPDQTFAVGTGGVLYTWQLSRTAALNERALFSTDLGELGNWRLQNGISLTVTVSRLLSLKLSHELKRLNRPVPGFRSTDTVLAAALVAKF